MNVIAPKRWVVLRRQPCQRHGQQRTPDAVAHHIHRRATGDLAHHVARRERAKVYVVLDGGALHRSVGVPPDT